MSEHSRIQIHPRVRDVMNRARWPVRRVSGKELSEFIKIMRQEGVCIESNDDSFIEELALLSRKYRWLQEVACSTQTSEEESEELFDYELDVEQAIRLMLAGHRIQPVFSGDPRGATVKLKVPSGKTNDFGGEGICVPWS